MSEWLGRPRIRKEDIQKYQPTFVENFPTLAKYFEDNQKIRITLVLDYEFGDKFIELVKNKYGKATPSTIHLAADEALKKWVEEG
ncbi:MAG: hypothetical protein ACTSRS_12140 [Candidatus Helarchaeota archaeon]